MQAGVGSIAQMMEGLVAVTPKRDCPHCTADNILDIDEFEDTHVDDPCKDCGAKGEVWICLKCKEVFCSRYVNAHMLQHHNDTQHPIVFSFADFSFWCFLCDSYVQHVLLDH